MSPVRFPNIKAGGAASTRRRRGLLSIKAHSWLCFVGPPVFCNPFITCSSVIHIAGPSSSSPALVVCELGSVARRLRGKSATARRHGPALMSTKALNVCPTSANERPVWKRDFFLKPQLSLCFRIVCFSNNNTDVACSANSPEWKEDAAKTQLEEKSCFYWSTLKPLAAEVSNLAVPFPAVKNLKWEMFYHRGEAAGPRKNLPVVVPLLRREVLFIGPARNRNGQREDSGVIPSGIATSTENPHPPAAQRIKISPELYHIILIATV